MKHYLLINLVLISNLIYGQSVGIGTTSPESSAILEVKSTTQGFMMPRMTTAQRDGIVAPKQGLQIYNSDDRCLDTYDGSKWAKNCDMKDNGNASLPANSWRPRADFGGTSRVSAVGFSIGGKGYIGTGDDGISYKKDFWEFDPASNVWTQKADFGGISRWEAVGFSIAGKGYVGTGSDGLLSSFKKDFWEYDPVSNTWTQKADFGGTARYAAVGFSIGGKGYIGTGIDATSFKKDFWEFDPVNNSWVQKADFGGTQRWNAVAFSIAGKGYIGTGYDDNYKKDFWEFIPAGGGLGSWVQKADFGGTARTNTVGFSISERGYIGTGQNYNREKDLWEYNPTTNTWMKKADFGGEERYDAIGFSIGNKGYIGTGLNTGFIGRDFWEYNTVPESGKVYVENIPSDAVVYQGHDWTSSGNNLYTTLENVNTTTRGLLNADGGFKTKYSGTIVKTIAAGASNIILNINPLVPSDWDFTNTMVSVSIADDPSYLRVIMYLAKLTSPGEITLSINALAAGSLRFNYIVFKL